MAYSSYYRKTLGYPLSAPLTVSLRHVLLLLFLVAASDLAMAQRVKKVPFSYPPEQTGDQYHQRVEHKTIPLADQGFVILSRQETGAFAIERYGPDLAKKWSTPVSVGEKEVLEAFAQNQKSAFLFTHATDGQAGKQILRVHAVDLQTGQPTGSKELLSAPHPGRRIGHALSEDGSRMVAYAYESKQEQIQALKASLYDDSFNKTGERTYDFRNLPNTLAAQVLVDNAGFQYVNLVSENLTKLTVRRYHPTAPEINVMEVQLGGVFEGRRVYMLDSRFQLEQDQALYAAAFCADEQTGEYHSLKAVKFDFAAGEMRLAPEFRFGPDYLTDMAKANKTEAPNPTRLEDIYLTSLEVTPEKGLVVIGEKKFMEGDENSAYRAQDLHLFAYNEYLNPTWRSVLMKNQQAPAKEAFSGISYRSALFDNTLYLLTQETIKNRTDLYVRQVDTQTGQATPPKPVKLKLPKGAERVYIKDFTAWLQEKNLVVVSRASTKSPAMQLTRLQLK